MAFGLPLFFPREQGPALLSVALQLLLLFCHPGNSLMCYDSATAHADDTRECVEGEVCYDEYFAVNQSGQLFQSFDRFCVHRQHCHLRGFAEKCVSLVELDNAVQESFYQEKLKSRKSEMSSDTLLVASRFCCCSTALCNNVDPGLVYKKFGFLPSLPTSPSEWNYTSYFIIASLSTVFLIFH